MPPFVKLEFKGSRLGAAAGFLLRSVRARSADPVQPIGRALAGEMQRGIEKQFDRETHSTPSGEHPWVPSIRARAWPGLGGSPRTMDNTGAYRAAASGRGPGTEVRVGARDVRVGVSEQLFPRVAVFQAEAPTTITGTAFGTVTIDPRPFGISRDMRKDFSRSVVRYILTGKAPRG